MIAFVRGVIFAATLRRVEILACGGRCRRRPASRRSAITTLAVAAKVSGVVITSSPGPTPAAISARWSAAVQELTAMACFAPT